MHMDHKLIYIFTVFSSNGMKSKDLSKVHASHGCT